MSSTPSLEPVSHPKKNVRTALSVLQLREAGYQFDEIAEILALNSPQDAIAQFERGLAALVKENPQTKQALVRLAERRLERLQRSVWAKANDPNHPDQMIAHQRSLAVIDRWIKLLGLDAASKLDVSVSPAREEIEALVNAISIAESALPEEEADILDADADWEDV